MIKVLKRSGLLEDLDIGKQEASLMWATKDVPNTSISEIMMRAKIHMYEGIPTSFIHDVFIKVCDDMSSLKDIGYDTVAKNLYVDKMYKIVYGSTTPWNLHKIVDNVKGNPKYNTVLQEFSREELDELDNVLDHSADFNYYYSGIKYETTGYGILEKGLITETPQIINILGSMDAFSDYPNRVYWIKKLYNKLKEFKITLPSPERRALRTPRTDYASCVLVRHGDSIDSYIESSKALVAFTVASAGVGEDIADVASVGDKVKNGDIVHSGKIPIIKSINSDVSKASQNGRRGSATPFINFFDPELLTVMSLKSPRMPEEDRINDLSYGIKVNQFVYDRARAGGKISLFSTRACPDMLKLFYSSDIAAFTKYYEECELKGLATEEIDARKFFSTSIATESTETSAYYIVNIDEANTNTPYKEPISQTNICVEVFQPTKPLSSSKPNSPDIGICVLGNINQGKVSIEELPEVTELIVRLQTHLASRQNHPMGQANAFVREYRDIGIGVSNHAYFLAKNKVKYGSEKALSLHDEWMEHFSYGLIKASMELAKEIGEAPKFREFTTWADGVMPIDRYKKTVDEIIQRPYSCDWDSLRKDVVKYGMANCGLTAVPPSESSSIPSNQTSSLEPIKDLLTVKDKSGSNIKQYAPEALKLAQYYDFAYDRDINTDFIKHLAITQKWNDKGISANLFYNPERHNGKVLATEVVKDLFFMKHVGCKARYYQNTKVPDTIDSTELETGCIGGACDV